MQREKLSLLVQDLLETKNDALITGNFRQLERLFTGDASSKKAFETEKSILLAKQRAVKHRGIKFQGHTTKVTTGPCVRAGNFVRINALETVTWWQEELGELRYERQQNNHRFVLEYTDSKWLIKEDCYRLEPKVATIPQPLATGKNQGKTRGNLGKNIFRGSNYDRAAAVRYAHKWWNSPNPNFRSFSVDCTNYVSQVLYAGGIPMTLTGKANLGWWYLGNGGPDDRWSYSWAVAHSLRWYLASGKGSLQTEAVQAADQLLPGDVICYDWDGDGVWQHNTVVVAFNQAGQPLVNSHTANSQLRFWDYRDSPAWTPKTNYLFWKIF